jgi:processive 1,2-diacylglycerol beta-glucosyltransferase
MTVVGLRALGYAHGLSMKRVLIFTAGYGEGHNAAARGLAAALTEAGAEAEVRDLFMETYGRRQAISQRLYIDCINHAAPLWALIYRALDRTSLMRAILPTLGGLQRKLADVLAERKPSAIASVYPVYGWLLDRMYPDGKRPFASHTIVTDSITVNSVWLRFRSDSWIVPNEATAEVVRRAVPPERVHALGFPVPLKFADSKTVRTPPAEGVPGEPLRVFYMVNADHQQAARLVRRLLEIPRVELTVAYGKDEAIGRAIAAAAEEIGRAVELHGWTPLVPELLMRNHILIGKAGGAATQEAIAAKTPMIITKAVPGQEEGNARLIVENECGALCETDDTIVETITLAGENNAALWHRWHESITKLSRPNASRDIARFILADELSVES